MEVKHIMMKNGPVQRDRGRSSSFIYWVTLGLVGLVKWVTLKSTIGEKARRCGDPAEAPSGHSQGASPSHLQSCPLFHCQLSNLESAWELSSTYRKCLATSHWRSCKMRTESEFTCNTYSPPVDRWTLTSVNMICAFRQRSGAGKILKAGVDSGSFRYWVSNVEGLLQNSVMEERIMNCSTFTTLLYYYFYFINIKMIS